MAENKMTMEEIQRYIFDKRCQGNSPVTPREIYDCLQLAYEYGRMSMTYVYPSQSKEKTMAEDRHEVTHLMGKKLDKPIILDWGTKTEDKNKMEHVARLFGKKLGEDFTVEDKYKAEWHCKFTKNGVMYQDRISFNWHMIGGMLQSLVTGKAVIVDD